jgi:hypothetical protein
MRLAEPAYGRPSLMLVSPRSSPPSRAARAMAPVSWIRSYRQPSLNDRQKASRRAQRIGVMSRGRLSIRQDTRA